METLPSCYTGGVTHTLHSLVLDCAMRGSGEVISKVFCLLHAVEELTSNFSLFVPSSIFLPGVCLGVGVLSQLWDKHFSSHRKRSTLNDIPLSPPLRQFSTGSAFSWWLLYNQFSFYMVLHIVRGCWLILYRKGIPLRLECPMLMPLGNTLQVTPEMPADLGDW